MSFILNTNSRTVHRSDSRDKRCQLQRLNPENALEFSTPGEALRYLSGTAPVRLCQFCLSQYIERPDREN